MPGTVVPLRPGDKEDAVASEAFWAFVVTGVRCFRLAPYLSTGDCGVDAHTTRNVFGNHETD